MLIIKRIGRIVAMVIMYVFCAYGYMAAKGFIIKDGVPVLSNPAYAEEKAFSQKVEGSLNISQSCMRAKGNENAPLTMYSYSSMACSHCSDFHNYILPKLEKEFIATGKLRFVFVHFPLEEMSMRAAKLSYCLPEANFEGFIDKLYHKKGWFFSKSTEELEKYAEEYGLTKEGIIACNENKKLTSDILLARESAIKDFGIKATPSFIIEGADGKELIIGSRSYEEFKDYLNGRLGENK